MTKILLKLVLFWVAGALSVLFSVELISQISGVAVWNSALVKDVVLNTFKTVICVQGCVMVFKSFKKDVAELNARDEKARLT